MLHSTGDEDTSYSNYNVNEANTLKALNNLSSSSSTSSSPSSFSPSNLYKHTQRPKTMEEVWKDINLSSLHDHPYVEHVLSATPRPHNNPHHNPNFLLQDFLARPFDKDPPISSNQANAGIYGSSAPHPATVLSLNSGLGFEFLDSSSPLRHGLHLQSHHPISNINSFNTPFEALDSPSGLPCFAKKRVQESNSSSGDRRHKRMIKNRESAFRSRARKQESTSPNAYTNELEIEVAHLLEENARLRRQLEELQRAATVQLHKKHTLYRTSTAPF